MPISVSCPECQSPYKVPDTAAGKAIKCKKCGATVPVPGGNGGGEAGGEGAPKKKGGMGKILAIVGGVLLLGCCCCVMPGTGGLAYYMDWIPGLGGGGGTIAVGGEKKGSIRKKDEKHEYKVTFEKDKTYVIDMKAPPPGDSLLRLFDPSGKEVASNDDAAFGTLDAQIRYKATQAGDFKIQATHGPLFPPGAPAISYTLSVKLDSGDGGGKDGKKDKK
jgi:predicted Zn finger-like uncharacterized protein